MLTAVPVAVEYTDDVDDRVISAEDVFDTVVTSLEIARLRRALRALPHFDRHLLTMRYGLAGLTQPRSLRELADRLNCSHTEVRRMEHRAIERLREIYTEEAAA